MIWSISASASAVGAGLGRLREGLAQMAFQHFGHQPGGRAAQGRQLLQQRAAFRAVVDGALQRQSLALMWRRRVVTRFFSCGLWGTAGTR